MEPGAKGEVRDVATLATPLVTARVRCSAVTSSFE
jgi:hypothetical protein